MNAASETPPPPGPPAPAEATPAPISDAPSPAAVVVPEAAEKKVPPVPKQPLGLRLSELGALEVDTDQGWVEVAVHRCFPWMEPGKFIALRQREGGELALVKSLEDLPGDSRAVLNQALQPATFTFDVQGILAIRKDVELRVWVVDTRQGKRTFETELDEWPRDVAGGALLIQDVCGDLYRIADHTKLDQKSQHLLWAFLN